MSKGKKGRRGQSGDEIFVTRRLRDAEAAVARGAWEEVRIAADAALRFDPANETASRLLGLALRQLGLLSERARRAGTLRERRAARGAGVHDAAERRPARIIPRER